jgi:ADP-dependent NAD(P)H-hydrate dehydratase / NAD(P)H-hydrate epimerase
MTLPAELYTAAQVRELDRRAIASGISGFELMSLAGRVAFNAILRHWQACRTLVILAGTGNNGGDGFVLAALASAADIRVTVLQCGDPHAIKGDALQAREQALARGIDVKDFSIAAFNDATGNCKPEAVLVDALLGTGFSGPLRGVYAEAVTAINHSTLPVLALDVPSGLCSSTGSIHQDAVRAAMTVTFVALKQGLFTGKGPACCGEIVFHNLDTDHVPPLLPSSRRIDIQSVVSLCKPRAADTHKGDCGHVLVVGGELGFGGAALMAAESAARSGAGTISLLTRSAHIGAALARRPELMVHGIDNIEPAHAELKRFETLLKRADVIVAGPGLGRSKWSRQLLQGVLQQGLQHDLRHDLQHNVRRTILVLDADALNLLSEDAGRIKRRDNWIFTPHPGEAARLLGCETAQIQADRFTAVRQLQAMWGGACVLKGAGSLLCYEKDGQQYVDVCAEGNPGMASGGMGDVLSGIIAAFIAQGLSLADGLRAGVCVHGESADLAAAASGQRGLLATDLFPYLRGLINFAR